MEFGNVLNIGKESPDFAPKMSKKEETLFLFVRNTCRVVTADGFGKYFQKNKFSPNYNKNEKHLFFSVIPMFQHGPVFCVRSGKNLALLQFGNVLSNSQCHPKHLQVHVPRLRVGSAATSKLQLKFSHFY